MAYYEPDLKYEEAKRIVKKLGRGERDQLIKYFIEKQKEIIESQFGLIDEYRKVFEGINNFLPNRNMRL